MGECTLMRSQSGARCPRGAAMPSEVLRELILELTEPDRLEIIREAGIRDDRPSLLRGDAQDGPPEEADSWVTQNGAKILPHLLRRIDPSDDEMVQLVQSGMLPFDRSLLKPRKFLVRFNHPAMRGGLFRNGSWVDRRWLEFTRYLRGRGDFRSCHGRNGCPHGCYRSDAELAEAKFRKGKKRRREGKSRCREGKSRRREGKSRRQKDRSRDNRPGTGK